MALQWKNHGLTHFFKFILNTGMKLAEMDTGHMIMCLCSLKIVSMALLHYTQNMILSGF